MAYFTDWQPPDWDFGKGKNLAVNLKNVTGGFYQGIAAPFAQGYAARVPGYFSALDQYVSALDPKNIPTQVAAVRGQLYEDASRQGSVAGAQAEQATGNPHLRQAYALDARNRAAQAGNRYLFDQYSPQGLSERYGAMLRAYDPSMLAGLYQVPLSYQPSKGGGQGGSPWDTVAGLATAAAAF